ncbi:MAG: type II toxin-antitoxin system HicA family toxin [Chloroflexia bacterium]|nr:type II toxin-antitoxin system HicA family toxin [Chloroflexia bacterium]
MPSDRLTQAIQQLSDAEASLRCDEMRQLLTSLRFVVRDGKKPGHKIVTHPQLAGFFSTSYTCGHGSNPETKPCYIKTIRKVLLRHEQALRNLEEEATQ